jgi:hypothetical protein
MRFTTLEGTPVEGREDELYRLWIVAVLTFGVGDVLTTMAFLYHTPGVEGNAVVRWLLGAFGFAGFVALKIAVFSFVLGVSVGLLHLVGSRFAYYFGPAVLSFYGALFTVWNLLGILSYQV